MVEGWKGIERSGNMYLAAQAVRNKATKCLAPTSTPKRVVLASMH